MNCTIVEKKIIEHTMPVLILFYGFLEHFYSKKNLARYDHKCTLVFM